MEKERVSELMQSFIFVSIVFFLSSYYLLPGLKDQVFYISAAVALLPVIYIYGRSLTRVDAIFILVVTFLLYFSISTLWSAEPGKYLSKTLRHSFYIFVGLIYFRLGLQKQFETKMFWLFHIMLASAVISLLMTLFYYPEFLVNNTRLVHMSFQGLAGNPIHTAIYFGAASLFSLYFYRISDKRLPTLVYFFLWLSLLVFVFLTKSRGPSLFYFIALFILIFTSRSAIKKRDYILFITLSIGIGLVLFLFFEKISGRMHEPNYRLDLLLSSWEIIKHNIWFGAGLSHDDFLVIESGLSFTKVHNSFVQAMQVGGLVGFTITMLMTLMIIKVGMQSESGKVKLVTAWFIFGCLALAVDGELMIDRPSREWFCYWIPFFFIYADYCRRSVDKSF